MLNLVQISAGICLLGFGAIPGAKLESVAEYAVIVHSENPIEELSASDMNRIFKLEDQHWKDKKKTTIRVYLPKAGTPDMQVLLDKSYKMTAKNLKKYWVSQIYRNKIARSPKSISSGALLIKTISRDVASIGFVNSDLVTEGSGVKVIRISKHKPGDVGYIFTSKSGGGRAFDAIPQDAGASSGRAETLLAAAPSQAEEDLLSRIEALEEAALDAQLEELSAEFDFSSGPTLSIRGFGHVQATIHDDELGGSDSNTSEFALGGLDLFLTSQLAENLFFLNETVFEPTEDGEYVLDVERVVLKYEISDDWSLQAGRLHTALGWWNEEYHHGEWLQASVGRPAVLNFEDEDGLLPVHMIGLSLKGEQSGELGRLKYVVELGNGRGNTPDPPQIIVDSNNQKAINVAVSILPASVEDLELGFGYYLDRISEKTDGEPDEMHGRIEETIVNAFLRYRHANWAFIGEYFGIEHDQGPAGDASSNGFYVQLERQFGDWTPYARFDSTDLDDMDTFFASLDDRRTTSVGVRWDYSDWSAIKLQVDSTDIDLAAGGTDEESSATVQVSFTF